jgi:glycosyltransferase involved in cell wall biosynthesis
MKISLLSYSDGIGGASASAYRLQQSLIANELDSQMLVAKKIHDDPTVYSSQKLIDKEWAKLSPRIDKLFLTLYPNRDYDKSYSLQIFPDKLLSRVDRFQPDAINLHWINAGFLQIETIAKFKKPIVWTLHDMWAFTGGCHYSEECNRYQNTCGSCPQLSSNQDLDISRWIWKRKSKSWHNIDLTIVTPSKWLSQCARNSSLFQGIQVKTIPYGLDIQKYQPSDKKMARKVLGLPLDKTIILFGATAINDQRKGFHLLTEALAKLQASTPAFPIELVIFGDVDPETLPKLGFPIKSLGRLSDEAYLSQVYAAADVFISPSLFENLSNAVMEALACGTCCVAFDIGGMPDMIEHKQNGYLAQPFDPEDLARGIAWTISDKERLDRLCNRAREKVEQEFHLDLPGLRYKNLFKELIN